MSIRSCSDTLVSCLIFLSGCTCAWRNTTLYHNPFRSLANTARLRSIGAMTPVLLLFAHFLTTLAKLLGPGGLQAVVSENLLIKHQRLVLHLA
jgi:hypothetical protein